MPSRVVPRSQYTGKRERLIVPAVTTDAKTQKLSIDTIRALAMDAVQKAGAGHPGHRDGAGAARLPALPASHASQPGQPGLAEPRPLHPLGRPRLHPPVRRPPPVRLQPLARGAEALPPVGVEDARPSGALRHRGSRDDDRPARPGLRERRRLRDRRPLPRRALQPAPPRDRRPPRLRDLLGRRPDGGRPDEAASIAGHLGLGRLVYFYDDNHITIDGTTALSFTTEDKGKRFEAYGWHVQSVADSEDLGALERATRAAEAEDDAPSLIVVRSHIAYGAPHAIDTAKSHGAPLGEDEVARGQGGARARSGQALRRAGRGVRAHGRASGGDRGRAGVARPLRALGGGVPEAARGLGRRPHRQAAAGLDRGAAQVPGRRGGRLARRRQEGDAGVQALHADDDRRRRRPRRVDEDRVRGRRASSRRRTRAATSPSASASTRWARS